MKRMAIVMLMALIAGWTWGQETNTTVTGEALKESTQVQLRDKGESKEAQRLRIMLRERLGEGNGNMVMNQIATMTRNEGEAEQNYRYMYKFMKQNRAMKDTGECVEAAKYYYQNKGAVSGTERQARIKIMKQYRLVLANKTAAKSQTGAKAQIRTEKLTQSRLKEGEAQELGYIYRHRTQGDTDKTEAAAAHVAPVPDDTRRH